MRMIYSHRRTSKAARLLSKALKLRLVSHKTNKLKLRTTLSINWGAGSKGLVSADKWINPPDTTNIVQNKLKCFQLLSKAEVPLVDWTTSAECAKLWADSGEIVIGRSLLRASSGKGIEVYRDRSEIANLPLYTKYVPRAREYRVHFFAPNNLFIQQKKRRSGMTDEQRECLVRNVKSNWVYCCNAITEFPDRHLPALHQAIASSRLDFGAIDVLVKANNLYVLEINTAPGLDGETTIAFYINNMQSLIEENES